MNRTDKRPTWLVEFVHPPGAFVVRELLDAPSRERLQEAMNQSLATIPVRGPWNGSQDLTGDTLTQEAAAEHQENMNKNRWLIFFCPYEGLARKMAESLAAAIGDSRLPWRKDAISDVTEVFRVVTDTYNKRKPQ